MTDALQSSNHSSNMANPELKDTELRDLEKNLVTLETESSESAFSSTANTLNELPSFSRGRLYHIVATGIITTVNAHYGTSIPSGDIHALSERFDNPPAENMVLLNSLYMIGFMIGPLIWGPMSEYVGRRPVLMGTYLFMMAFSLACSASPTFEVLLTLRCLTGIAAAAPTAITPGLYADVLDDDTERGNAMALYMAVTSMAPLGGPIVSGFSSVVDWRLPFWINSGLQLFGLPFVLLIPETYAPVRRQQQYKAEGRISKVARPDAKTVFVRPLKMLFTEPILLSSSLYMTLAYSVYFLNFQAYPRIFQDFYGLSPGMAGMAFLPNMLGTAVGFIVFLIFARYYIRRKNAGAAWAQREIYRRLPLACVAAPFLVAALFWLAWTPSLSTPPIVPMLGGSLYGFGYQLVFNGMINFVSDAYLTRSASAHAGAAMMRSTGAVLLPLAAKPMFDSLGIHWPLTILACITILMGFVPFVFIYFGRYMEEKAAAARKASMEAIAG